MLSTKKHSPTAGSAKKLRRKSTDSLMKQLDQLERKIALGRERSQYFKQMNRSTERSVILSRSLLHNSLEGAGMSHSNSKMALVTEMEEHVKLEKLAKYLEKQKKHEEMLTNQKEYHDYQLEALKQKQR